MNSVYWKEISDATSPTHIFFTFVLKNSLLCVSRTSSDMFRFMKYYLIFCTSLSGMVFCFSG